MAHKSFTGSAVNLAHHVKAISDIIKGALQGGWTGAAVAALKHYWPQIMIISFVMFFLPAILFFSLPSLVFDAVFSGSELTVEEKIYQTYGDYEMMTGSRIEKINYEFCQNGYDEPAENTKRIYVNDSEICGEILDIYWFTAIFTVYIENEIPSKEQIEAFTANLFTYSTSEYLTGETVKEFEPDSETGVTPPPVTEIYINRTLTFTFTEAYALMDNLNFNKTETAWAENIYKTITGGEITKID